MLAPRIECFAILNSFPNKLKLIFLVKIIHIPDPPEIKLQQQWTAERGRVKAEITCMVHAEPKPEIRQGTLLLFRSVQTGTNIVNISTIEN